MLHDKRSERRADVAAQRLTTSPPAALADDILNGDEVAA
jgi:hypothetical protein